MERIKQALKRAYEERQRLNPEHTDLRQVRRPAAKAGKIASAAPTRKIEVTWEALRNKRVVSASDTDPSAKQYRLLRSQLQQRFSTTACWTIGVTSANSAEGKSLSATNLAISMTAEIGNEVLLIDSDLRRPSLHQYFGAEQGIGLVDVLGGRAPIDEALVDSGIVGLTLLLGGTPTIQASELLDSPNMISLMEDLKKGIYSNIIFDLPPVLVAEDAFVFAPRLDGILLVIEEGAPTPKQLKRTIELLKTGNVLGSVLNKSRRQQDLAYY